MNIMPNADPIFDLGQCAQALAHGHDPAEIAVLLQGIIERLRQVRTAEDERRDVLAFLRADVPHLRARPQYPVFRMILDTLARSIDNGEHVEHADILKARGD